MLKVGRTAPLSRVVIAVTANATASTTVVSAHIPRVVHIVIIFLILILIAGTGSTTPRFGNGTASATRRAAGVSLSPLLATLHVVGCPRWRATVSRDQPLLVMEANAKQAAELPEVLSSIVKVQVNTSYRLTITCAAHTTPNKI